MSPARSLVVCVTAVIVFGFGLAAALECVCDINSALHRRPWCRQHLTFHPK